MPSSDRGTVLCVTSLCDMLHCLVGFPSHSKQTAALRPFLLFMALSEAHKHYGQVKVWRVTEKGLKVNLKKRPGVMHRKAKESCSHTTPREDPERNTPH